MKQIIITFALLLLVACAQQDADGRTISLPNADNTTLKEPASYPEANNRVAIDLYKALNKQGENLFFSPWSIFSALSMVYEGADGNTATELAKTLYLFGEDTSRHAYFAAMQELLNAKNEYTIENANALWIDQTFPILTSYKDVVTRYYAGDAMNTDFINASEPARLAINAWVETKTHGKIKDIIKELSGDTRAVLVNAIYFKGSWTEEFDEKLTKDEDFYLTPKDAIKVPLMRKYGDTYNYGENDLLQLIELPYKGENLSMVILLPKAKTLDLLEEELSADTLADWKNLMRERKVDIFVPKFRLETDYDLKDTLKLLGINDAFKEWEAKFTKLYDHEKLQEQCYPESCNIFISKVLHKAFVEVNEEGTEAAAATAVIFEVVITSVRIPEPTPQFRADHPFIFLIQERTTGNILFMGKVANPK